MSRGQAQALTVSIPVVQNIDISNPVEGTASAQALTVTMGTNYIIVNINTAIKLPQT